MREMQKGQAGHRHRTVHGDGAERAVSIDTVVPCYGGCEQLNTRKQSLPGVGRPKEVENGNWNQTCKWTGIGQPREPLLTVGELKLKLKQGLDVSGTLFWKVLKGPSSQYDTCKIFPRNLVVCPAKPRIPSCTETYSRSPPYLPSRAQLQSPCRGELGQPCSDAGDLSTATHKC